jgi:hypothetical protein
MDEPEQVLVVPPQTLRYIAIATTVLYIALAVVVVYVFLNARHTTNNLRAISQRNATAVAGLCALKLDLAVRVASSEEFLRQHPEGIPGVPVSVIRSGIVNQRHTLDALAVVKCAPVEL